MFDAYSPRKTAEGVPPLPATDSSIFTPPQPISVGTEPLMVEGGRTVRDWEMVAVFPPVSVTVNEMVYVPFVNDCETGLPVLLVPRSEEHTSELQSRFDLVCRLLLE